MTMRDLGRKVERKNWSRTPESPAQLPADTLADLKTSKNTLSFWLCDREDTNSIEKVAIALASVRQRIDPIDVALADRQKFINDNIELVATPGNSLVKSINDRHRDAVKLDAIKICQIASILMGEIEQGQLTRIAAVDVGKLLLKAIENDEISPDTVSPELRKSLIDFAQKQAITTKLSDKQERQLKVSWTGKEVDSYDMANRKAAERHIPLEEFAKQAIASFISE